MKTLFLDIETLPAARADVREYIAAGVTPPGNISKAETIAKWNAESRPQAVEDAIHKTSLDGTFGRVCCIGFALDDGAPVTIFSADDERLVLRLFAEALHERLPAHDLFTTVVVGHNVSAFDLRFLVQRYIVNSMQPPAAILRAAEARPWEASKVFDTMVQWAGVGNRISLDKLCMALSIPSPKGELDGSKVAEFVAAGRHQEVRDYCERDVAAVRVAWGRMTFREHSISPAQR